MINFIVVLILAMILVPVIRYIVKEKKKGNTCIGCPNASKCGKHNCHGLSYAKKVDDAVIIEKIEQAGYRVKQ